MVLDGDPLVDVLPPEKKRDLDIETHDLHNVIDVVWIW